MLEKNNWARGHAEPPRDNQYRALSWFLEVTTTKNTLKKQELGLPNRAFSPRVSDKVFFFTHPTKINA